MGVALSPEYFGMPDPLVARIRRWQANWTVQAVKRVNRKE
jgi:hypothetical protein